MDFSIGSQVVGVISVIKPFGMFVNFPDNRRGLCHISQMSTKYVKNIYDIYKVGDKVKFKIIGIDDQQRLDLSIKQVQDTPEAPDISKQTHKTFKSQTNNHYKNKPPLEYKPIEQNFNCFDDMVKSYMKRSEEKQRSINKRCKKRK